MCLESFFFLCQVRGNVLFIESWLQDVLLENMLKLMIPLHINLQEREHFTYYYKLGLQQFVE